MSNKENFSSNPNEIEFLIDLPSTIESFSSLSIDNTISVFKSIDDLIYLIYSNKKFSIITYDLVENNKKCEIKNAHKTYITNLRHYLDNENKADIIISISSKDSNIKLWNINNLECLLNLEKIYNNGFLYSACILFDNNKKYIITSNFQIMSFHLYIKVYDFNGNKIKEIDNGATLFIDTYYDKNFSKNYIIIF